MYIYKIINKINNKIYIGQSEKDVNVEYIGSGKILLKAIKKYGKANFNKEIIETCDSKEQLNEREKHWIKFYNSNNRKIGYNISIGGDGGNLGDLVNKKISDAVKGLVSVKDESGNCFRVNKNDERFLKRELVGVLSGVVAHNKGKLMSELQKKKLRKPKSLEHKLSLSKSRKEKMSGTKKIICSNNNVTYNSLNIAAKELNLTASNITEVLKGRAKATKGFVFVYA